MDGVLYSGAEENNLAEKASRFHDQRPLELIMSSPDPSTHKRTGRGVRDVTSAVGDREDKTAMLSGT